MRVAEGARFSVVFVAGHVPRCDSAGEVDEDERKESLGKFHG